MNPYQAPAPVADEPPLDPHRSRCLIVAIAVFAACALLGFFVGELHTAARDSSNPRWVSVVMEVEATFLLVCIPLGFVTGVSFFWFYIRGNFERAYYD